MSVEGSGVSGKDGESVLAGECSALLLASSVLVLLFVLSCAALIWAGSTARRLVRELEAAKRREEGLNRELLHRVKNMLATVNAMALLTARYTPPEEFAAALDGRLRALERATGLLRADEPGHDPRGQHDQRQPAAGVRRAADEVEPGQR